VRDFIWLAGLVLRIAWIAFLLVTGMALLVAMSMTYVSALGVSVLFQMVAASCPLVVLTYIWLPHAQRQSLGLWLRFCAFGWVIAIPLFLAFRRTLEWPKVWAGIIPIAIFYCCVGVLAVVRITKASPDVPRIARRPVFWMAVIVAAVVIQSGVWYVRRDRLLIDASNKGHERRAAFLLRIGANSNGAPLIAAAARGNAAIVRALLAAGAEVNYADAGGRTALFGAAHGGHEEVCRVLLAAGAKADVVTRGHSTPLQYAVEAGSLPIVEMLLKAGAPVDEPGVTGFTPFMSAVADKRFEIAETLSRSGANVNATDWKGQTVLQWAGKQSKDDIVAFLRATYPDAR
jgi:hypothetical protein